MIKVFFQRVFSIYPGEEKKALLFASLGFLWSLAVTAGLKFADALFLLHVGAEHLPLMYTSTSCAMIVLASFLLYLYHIFPVRRIYLAAISIVTAFYFFAFFCVFFQIGTESGWLWYLLRICGSLFFTVTLTCYWTFIDLYHSLQDAKRLYCLYSSVIFLGYAVTGSIMRSGLVEIPVVTLSIATLLIFVSFLIHKISNQLHPVHDENTEDAHTAYREKYSLKKLLKTIIASRFTLLLLAGNFTTYVLFVLTEYNYMSSFESYYEPAGSLVTMGSEEDAPLTQYLGQWLAIVSLFNIVFGLFLYSRIIRTYGVGSLLICTPLLCLFIFSGWSVSDAMFFPILGIFFVEGTLNVIDDNNFNILLNAIPSKIKNKTRVFIESFFEPVGIFVSSLLLAVPWFNSKYLGVFFSLIFIVIVLLQRKQYAKAIYKNLADHAVHFQRPLHEWLTPKRKKELLVIAGSDDQRILLTAAKGILAVEDAPLFNTFLSKIPSQTRKETLQNILSISKSQNESTKQEFLQLIKQNNETELVSPHEIVQRLHGCESSELTLSYLSFLGEIGHPSFAKPIVEASVHFRPNERRFAQTVIEKMGSGVVPPLFEILKSSSYHDRCRILAGRILGRLSLPELRKTLYDFIGLEIDRAYFYYYHHHTIQQRYTTFNLKILTDGLLSGHHSAMDLIIQLFGAAGELEDPELLSRSFKSPHPKTRSKVVEALEKTCETKLYRLLQPLVMDMPEPEKIKGFLRRGGDISSLDAVIAKLTTSPSPIDHIQRRKQ